MKTLAAFLLMIIFLEFSAKAQTYAEWFRQGKTQRQYLIGQNAALKAYAEQVRKGYNLLKEGTKLICDIKNGDFDLHFNHFSSLGKVNPKIKNYQNVKDILRMHDFMEKSRRSLLQQALQTNRYNNAEKQDIKTLIAGMAGAADVELEQLEMVVADGHLKMTDDERLVEIDKIYNGMQNKYTFHINTSRDILGTISSRQRKLESLKILRKL